MSTVEQALEHEVAGHAMFGEPHNILDRARRLRLMLLDAASRDLPAARELHRELSAGGAGTCPSALGILDDPVVMRGVGGLRAVKRYGRAPPPESGELFSAILRHWRNGAPGGLPVTAGCPIRVHLGPSAPSVAVWDPDLPESVVKRSFESAVADSTSGGLSGQRRSMVLRRPEPVFVHSIEQGYGLLALVLPELSASVLAHVRLIGIFDHDAFSSMTTRKISSTVFLNGATHLRTPWRMAATLLHEAAHRKLMDMSPTRRIGARSRHGHDSPRIRAVWRRDAAWSVKQTLGVLYVYVGLALFHARVRTLGEARLAAEFGPPRVSAERALETALDRADYLGRALAAHAGPQLGPDGRSLFAWLSGIPARLGNADREIAAMLDRIRSSRPAIVTT